jgi:hypothetical protein
MIERTGGMALVPERRIFFSLLTFSRHGDLSLFLSMNSVLGEGQSSIDKAKMRRGRMRFLKVALVILCFFLAASVASGQKKEPAKQTPKDLAELVKLPQGLKVDPKALLSLYDAIIEDDAYLASAFREKKFLGMAKRLGERGTTRPASGAASTGTGTPASGNERPLSGAPAAWRKLRTAPRVPRFLDFAIL